MNFKDKIKLEGWYLLHDKPRIKRQIKQFLHILKLEDAPYYEEFDKYYKTLDVKNKLVVDLGSDIGASPMYFIKNGANTVIGFSRNKQYFRNVRYHHINTLERPEVLSKTIEKIKRMKEEFDSPIPIVLKSDCEGCEWKLPEEFIDEFEDWIIAVHNPVGNRELMDYIVTHGILIAEPEGCEFGVYQKKKGE